MNTPTTIDLADLNAALAARKGDIVRKPAGAEFRVLRRRGTSALCRPLHDVSDTYCEVDRFDTWVDLTGYVAA